MRRPLGQFLCDDRGAVAVIAAVSGALLLGFGALAVDMGSVYLQTRKLQGMADLAAIAAARDLLHADAAAQATASNNGWDGAVASTVVTGVYVNDPAVAVGSRFTPGGASPDAARVTLTAQADLFFGAAILGRRTTTISRTATAATANLASFSIGTRLASLQGGVANSLLSALTGSTVSLSVMDYNALADAQVDLLSYSKALQTNLSLQAVSFDKVLQSQVSTGRALSVLADVLSTGGSDPAAAVVRKLATAAGDATPAQLDKLLDLGPYGDQDHVAGASGAGVKLNAMDMANGILTVAQSGHQVQLNLGANVPGLTDTTVYLALGNRMANSPWITVTRDKSVIVRTAQTRLYIDSKVGTSGGLNLAGIASVRVPVFVEVASGQAKLAALNCPLDRASRSAQLSVLPSIGQLSVADIDKSKLSDFSQDLVQSPATLVSLLSLVKITGFANAKLGGVTWKTASFSQAEIDAGTIKTVATDDVAQALVGSLLGSVNVNVQVLGFLGLGVNGALLGSGVSSLLSSLASPLDGLINTVTGIAGVKLGQADVRVNGLRCGEAALVA